MFVQNKNITDPAKVAIDDCAVISCVVEYKQSLVLVTIIYGSSIHNDKVLWYADGNHGVV